MHLFIRHKSFWLNGPHICWCWRCLWIRGWHYQRSRSDALHHARVWSCGGLYQDLSEYCHYRGFSVKTVSWVTKFGRSVDFRVWVLVPPGKRFKKTPFTQTDALINVHGSLCGWDMKTGSIILAMKDFNFLPRSSSTSPAAATETEQGSPPETHLKQGWGRPNSVSPSNQLASASPSGHTAKPKWKRVDVPCQFNMVENSDGHDSDHSSSK